MEVCLRYILEYATRRGSSICQLFDTIWKNDHFVASRRRWLEHQGEREALQESWQNEWHDIEHQGIMAKDPPCAERTLKTPLPRQSSSSRDEERQWISVEDGRRRRVAFEKMGVTALHEQLETSEGAGVSIRQIAQQAMNENGQHIFIIFGQGEEDVSIASLARWNAQLKGLAELEKRSQRLMQDVKLFSERQKKKKGMVEDNQVAEQSNGKVLRAYF